MQENLTKKIYFIFWELLHIFPNPQTELHFKNTCQLLVAVILSAQCTDKRVNKITEKLFIKYSSFQDFANANFDEIFKYTKTCSYPRNKTNYIIKSASLILKKYKWQLPSNQKELQTLPWVWVKTAKVILNVIFNKKTIAVDTHILRVSNRLWLVNEKKPNKVSEKLEIIIPNDIKIQAHHLLILFWRYICTAKKPKCDKCPLLSICKYKS